MSYYIPSSPSKTTCIGNTLSTFNISLTSLDTNLYNLSTYAVTNIDLINTAGITLQKGDDGKVIHYYVENYEDSYTNGALLTSVLAEVPSDSTIILEKGSYGILNGYSWVDFLENGVENVKIRFTDGSSVLYANEVDACDDCNLYEGTTRYAINFSATPYVSGSPVDMQPRIQAALFSMPIFEGYALEPITDYPSISSRQGTLFLTPGDYYQSKTIYMTGNQQIIGQGGGKARLVQMTGFAPGTPTEYGIPQIRVVRPDIPGIGIGTNFLFNVEIRNLTFFSADAANTDGTAIWFAGAQGSIIDNITISGMGNTGIWCIPGNTYFVLNRIWCVGVNDYQVGPHIRIAICFGFKMSNISLEFLNYTGAVKTMTVDGKTFTTPGLLIYQCAGFDITSINGEAIRSLIRIQNARKFTITSVSVIANDVSIGADIMISLQGTTNYSILSIEGTNFRRQYVIQNDAGFVIDESVSGRGISDFIRGDEGNFGQMTLQQAASATGLAKAYQWQAGGASSQVVGVFYGISPTDVYYRHMMIQPVGGAAGEMPSGYTICFNTDGGGGVYTPSVIRANKGFAVIYSTVDPTISDVAEGFKQTWRNTTLNETRDWTNIGGIMYKSAVYT